MLALVGLLAILKFTLSPFTFRWHSIGLSDYLFRFEHVPSGLLDFPENVLLFIPFGLGVALALEQRIRSPGSRTFVVIALGCALSLWVESLQIFLPKRTPNLSDILSNTLGALAGAWILQLWHARMNIPGAVSARIIRWDIRIIFGGYLVLLLLTTWLCMTGLRPAFWDAGYRLALGNETTGDWDWNGSIRDLTLFTTGMNRHEAAQILKNTIPERLKTNLVGSYSLTASGGLKEEAGRLPEFVPQGHPPEFTANGVILRKNSWLRTTKSLADFAESVNRTREYAIAATISTPKPAQWEAPRIISLSASDDETDVMISHYRDEIEFRWRAPLTGEGTNPQLYFPNTFRSTEPFRFVISQRKNTIGFYTSFGQALEVFLGPEVGLAALLTGDAQWLVQISAYPFWPAAAFFALVFYAPAGAYINLWLKLARCHAKTTLPAIVAFCLVPPLLAEWVVALYGDKSLRVPFVAVGMFFALMGFSLVAFCRRRWALASHKSQSMMSQNSIDR